MDTSGTVEVSTRTLEMRLTLMEQIDETTRDVGIKDEEIKTKEIGEHAVENHNRFMVMLTTSPIKMPRITMT